MLDKQAANDALERLKPMDFYAQSHQLIFACMAQLIDRGQPCDPVTVGDMLRMNGDLERVGGASYLSALLDAVPAPSAAAYYADIVVEKAQSRALLDAISAVLSSGYEGGYQANELLEMAEKSVFDISQGRRRGDLHPLSDLLAEVYVMMSNIKAASGVTGVPTFTDLDVQYLSGLQNGDLILLAARPGMGKTSMAINIAQQAAARHGKVVAVFSLEMPKEQLVQRMLCTEARVDHSLVQKGRASKSDFTRLKKAVTYLGGAKLYIDDTMSVTVSEMRSKCRKLKMDQGLDLVVVDYIQLMQAGGGRKSENRQLEVAEISRSLKAMAKELNVPVLALSQLSRQAETGKEPPGLAHLRESGALEQDADVVLMLYQKKPEAGAEGEGEQWKRSKDGETVEVIVAKHRNGPTGSVDMVFIRQYTLFSDKVQEWAGAEPPPPEAAAAVPPDEFDVF
jgi:replicative DNA helicase